MSRTLRSLGMALVALAFTLPAAAQDIDPETGEVYQEEPETPPAHEEGSGAAPWYAGGPTGTEPPPPAETTDSTPSPSAADTPTDSNSGQDDHERVVGHLAVGFMGLNLVPVGNADTGDTVSAPALGIRYWITDLLGIDAGIGLGYIGGNTSVGGLSVPNDDAFAMTIHAGVPLALFHAEHYKLLVIPEVNVGFATGTDYDQADPTNDQGRSGILFRIGGRIGTEIHFGFMEIPQLSLQASVGLYFDYLNRGLGPVTVNAYALGTTVQGEPWDILLGALNALYYFE